MGGFVPSMCWSPEAGVIVKLPVRKRKGETYAQRCNRCRVYAVSRYRQQHVAVRYNRKWTIYDCASRTPVIEGISEDAAYMWLMHRASNP